MKRLFLILGISLFLLAAPVFAKKPEVPLSCNPDANWKNHGEYVSCVAKIHQGGKNVSEAAKSDIGKKEASPSPSVSPSAPSSASPSPTGIGTTSPVSQITIEGTKIEIRALIAVLQKIIESLKHLI